MPQLEELDKEILNRDITIQDIQNAIKKQKNYKMPGPDGFPGEYYKELEEKLGNMLVELYNDALSRAKISNTWKETYTTLIMKEGTEKDQIKNYRPVSLLNADYKIFMTILADRLKFLLNKIIYSDQNGFLPMRQIKDNSRMMLDILEYYEAHPERQVALVFLDAQKAFDNVNWQFIVGLVKEMKFGDKFEKLLGTIYSSQAARLIINGELTKEFKICKGVRQGCPMSPLLFILTLEILLNKIRSNQEIKGTKVKKEEYKLLAFADDLVFFLEDPRESGLQLLKEIEEYGKVAGLKINKQKTKILTKNMNKEQKKELGRTLGLQITKRIKYLGIILTNRCSSLKKDNYDKLLNQAKKDLERWKKIQISFLGRIAVVKMNLLPKFLYLFQAIPIKLEPNFFMDLNKIISKFVWQDRKSRIKLIDLQDDKSRGGLGLPEWKLYYKAASLAWIKDWIDLKKNRMLTLEGHDLQKGWHAYLWEDRMKLNQNFKKHLIRNSLLRIWEEIKKKNYIKIPKWLSPMEAIINPNSIEEIKKYKYSDLLDLSGKLKNREKLEEQNIKMDWWTYLRLKLKFKRDVGEVGIEMETHKLDKILLGPEQKIISKLYKYLLDYERIENVVKDPMIAWARDIGYSIYLADWERTWNTNCKITKSIPFKENFYKMFYRWHISPSKLAKIYPNLNLDCWKCKVDVGTFFHMWWLCPNVKKYWKKIHCWLEEITGRQMEYTPEFFLLGIVRKQHTKDIKYLLLHIITAARMTYAQYWKDDKSPVENVLIEKIYRCAEMDRLTMELKGQKESDYYKIWTRWYDWMGKRREKQSDSVGKTKNRDNEQI